MLSVVAPLAVYFTWHRTRGGEAGDPNDGPDSSLASPASYCGLVISDPRLRQYYKIIYNLQPGANPIKLFIFVTDAVVS